MKAAAHLAVVGALVCVAAAARAAPVEQLRITLLSTTDAAVGRGEWGFAALVEADQHVVLFDTGKGPTTVRDNLAALHLEPKRIEAIVLSHRHSDHTGGLAALSGRATLHRAAPAPVEIAPGVWVTGPIARRHREEDNPVGATLPDEQALVIETRAGLVVVSGCAHAGVLNTVDAALALRPGVPLAALVGGLHLYRAGAPLLAFVAAGLVSRAPRALFAAHCTGATAVRRLRDALRLGETHARLGVVGDSLTIDGTGTIRIASYAR